MANYAKKIIITLGVSSILSCADKPKSFDASKTETAEVKGAEAIPATAPEMKPVIGVTIDNRSIEDVLCQEGPRVTAAAKKADFSAQFALICEGGRTNALFKSSITGAYQGTGVPQVNVVKLTTDDNFVTNITLVYAIKAPLANPSLFADLKPHDIFAAGIRESNSELAITVESRASFPGKASVEQVVLNYDLKVANGASIFDRRRTEFNTYLLVESNRDIAVSTEHLLDADTNEYYHIANGLTIGLKAENNQSYLLFVTDLVIKNRIEPERMKVTLSNLNMGVAKMLQKHLLTNAPK